MHIEYIGNISYDQELLRGDRKVVIFGAGVYGRKIYKYLKEKGISQNIVCFCDSNSKLGKNDNTNIPILEPLKAFKYFPDADYLISGKYSKEMYELLKENLIDRIHILVSVEDGC